MIALINSLLIIRLSIIVEFTLTSLVLFWLRIAIYVNYKSVKFIATYLFNKKNYLIKYS